MSILVIVESPGKIKKIQSYLGNNYIVKASFGHCRDLQSKTLSIDVDNNFKPLYSIIPGKKKVIDELKRLSSKCSKVILAADEDREGEMIASSLRDLLELKKPERIVFHEITKKAINDAVNNPTVINENMVYAQQARRLLDRLVGFRISPLLWKKVKGQLSAGRVQSVVVKIVIEKENEINEFIKNNNSSYYKTTGIFNINENDYNCVLMDDNLYNFKENEIKPFLQQFNKDTKYIINSITNKEKKQTPPKPFITSTLQQDASTKLRFTPKRTMGIAQKLYEAGYITYMRTDSFNLSGDILGQCKKYIVDNYTDKYYKFRQFSNKKGAQEAHEAIRPTNILKTTTDEKMTIDCKKLYELIWKRTVASQMVDAKINVMDINIDCINDKSILPKDTFFNTEIETITFNGYLIIYDKENEDIPNINKKNKCSMNSINIFEEFEKLPLRYNEAGLIKHLEKQGIGRPSTYASIMDKIISRNYVNILNVDGIEKESNTYTLSKTFKITNKTKKVFLGKENKKIIPTQLGIDVNNFMLENFDTIMDTKYTAKMETYLDKIADGKMKWHNLLDMCYKEFNPTVELLEEELKNITNTNKTETLIGKHPETGVEIYSLVGRYGPCVRMDKQFAPINDINNVTLDMAVKLFEYPKYLGKIGKSEVKLCKGQYGLYFKVGKKNVGIKDKERELTLEYARELYETEPGAIKTFKVKNQKVFLKNGPYGHYLQYTKNGKRVNKKLPNDIDINKLDSVDLFI